MSTGTRGRTPSRQTDAKESLEVVLEAFAAVAREEILRVAGPDSCILSTRVAIAALARYGVRAEPCLSRAVLSNSSYRRFACAFHRAHGRLPRTSELPQDAWAVGIGGGSDAPFTEHLVALVRRRALVDPSAEQANRPQRGIVVPPVVVLTPVSRAFMRGQETADALFGDTHVSYCRVRTHGRGTDYTASRDWTDSGQWRPIARRVTRRMDEML